MKDKKPLGEWYEDYRLVKDLHLSLSDIDNMDYEKRWFFLDLLDEEIKEYNKKIRDTKRNRKRRSSRR
ncbi:MAG: hypothetical protein ACTSR3_01205 [Candidatus Helarchaeota archaeon]